MIFNSIISGGSSTAGVAITGQQEYSDDDLLRFSIDELKSGSGVKYGFVFLTDYPQQSYDAVSFIAFTNNTAEVLVYSDGYGTFTEGDPGSAEITVDTGSGIVSIYCEDYAIASESDGGLYYMYYILE